MSSGIVLVTGASSGIGESITRLLSKRSFTVYGAARRMDRMKPLEADGIHILPLDLTDEASIKACVETILQREGRIDVLINNAGYPSYGAVEDAPIDDDRQGRGSQRLTGLNTLVAR